MPSQRIEPAESCRFFLLEGLAVRNEADIERIRATVEERLAPVGHKVYAVIN